MNIKTHLPSYAYINLVRVIVINLKFVKLTWGHLYSFVCKFLIIINIFFDFIIFNNKLAADERWDMVLGTPFVIMLRMLWQVLCKYCLTVAFIHDH